MTVRTVIRMGDPRLLERSKEIVNFNTPELHQLVSDMWETMAEEEGLGLAAPQIAEPVRLVVFGYESNPRYPDAPVIPETVLINPVITPLNHEMNDGWEGCLSVPGLRGLVSRYTHIQYTGFDEYGKKIDRKASGFHARVIQHECDHLDGLLYPQRIEDMKNFGFNEELNAVMENYQPEPCDT